MPSIDGSDALLLRAFDALQSVLSGPRFRIAQLDTALAAGAAHDAPSSRGAALQVRQLRLGQFMHVDSNTMRALRIVSAPNAYEATVAVVRAARDGAAGNNKRQRVAELATRWAGAEGALAASSVDSLESLYVLHTSSAPGRALMRRWLRAPLADIDLIERRQRAVAFFVTPQRRMLSTQLKNQLATLPNIEPLLRKLCSGARHASLSDWQALSSEFFCSLHKFVFRQLTTNQLCKFCNSLLLKKIQ